MTPHVALLLATLIQPSDPNQGYALLDPQSSIIDERSELVIPEMTSLVSESAPASRTTILFSFPNRHDYVAIRGSDVLAPNDIRNFSHFVRCYRTNKEKSVAPRLIEIVLAAAEHFGVDTVEIISGYRARPYGAPHSKHFLGQALDIRVPGISSARLSDWLWATFNNVGVGYYPRQNFVHIDTRDADIRWVDKSRHGESGSARYFTRTGRALSSSVVPSPSGANGRSQASMPLLGTRG